ncbi:hypothetical protein ACXR0O_25495 [Verrucomicrobiota bacterium sgz303538]
MEIDEAPQWKALGISGEFLEAKAAWLREQRNLHDRSFHFFDLAGKLVSLSRFDYLLSSLAFFQAVVGVERALRLHFDSEERHYAELFANAVRDGVIHDSLFQYTQPLSKRLLKKIEARPSTHSEILSFLVPKLRNEFVHGTYLLSPEYIPLTFQMREIADALTTKRF